VELLGKEGKQLYGNWKEGDLIEVINSRKGAGGKNPMEGSMERGWKEPLERDKIN
tara:strand:+ start:540 stop:704 length:165 start_codon:yes stop_codon:yes gene_type:complete